MDFLQLVALEINQFGGHRAAAVGAPRAADTHLDAGAADGHSQPLARQAL